MQGGHDHETGTNIRATLHHTCSYVPVFNDLLDVPELVEQEAVVDDPGQLEEQDPDYGPNCRCQDLRPDAASPETLRIDRGWTEKNAPDDNADGEDVTHEGHGEGLVVLLSELFVLGCSLCTSH